MDPITRALHARVDGAASRPAVTPLYQTSGFEAGSAYFYSRRDNPNVAELEQAVAGIEGAGFAVAATTGMTAIALTLELLQPGDAVALSRDVYGCTVRLFERAARRRGLRVVPVDLCSRAGLESLPEGTALVFLETPTNPFLKTIEIRAVRQRLDSTSPGALLVVDNTWATPLFQHPLEHGADLSLHSATKFLSGHGDVMGGFALTNRADLSEELRQARFYSGSVLDPHSAWLLRRSLQTFELRMREHQRATDRIAAFLSSRPEVRRVHLPTVDGRQLVGYGGIVCFELRQDLADRYPAFASALRLFGTGTTMSCATSMVAQPHSGSHASLSDEEKRSMGLGEGLVRLCLGFEAPDDLEADLASAFEAIGVREASA